MAIVPADYVLIEVEDTGHGIPADVREKIFEPFFTTKEVGKGTGLGLSMVYGIVKQTGGYIFCESEPGAGATFRILLPRLVGDEADEPVKKEAPKPAADLTGRGAILLVEDEEAVRAFAARALSSRGYTVLEAESGVDALRRRRGGRRTDRSHRFRRDHAGNGRTDHADGVAPPRLHGEGRLRFGLCRRRLRARVAGRAGVCLSAETLYAQAAHRNREGCDGLTGRFVWPSRGSVEMRFEGTKTYVAGDELKTAVNAAIALERPLLVKGEPGTGKTLLAQEIADAIGAPFIAWHIKSTTRAQQGLYEYDAVSRLRDSQLGDPRVSDIANYIRRGKLWEAFTSPTRPVLLIDEIDKADIEFPNDLLLELDQMEFHVYETGETVRAKLRPIVIITSNNEKELPDAFLRRCFFHYIRFPDAETMRAIVESHFPSVKPRLVEEAMRSFFTLRETPGLKKKPTTSELLDWLKLLLNEDVSPETLREREAKKLIPPLHGALLKNEQDVHLFEKLAFLSRRER